MSLKILFENILITLDNLLKDFYSYLQFIIKFSQQQQIKPMQNQNFAFGLPTLPRQKQPCMFQILSWAGQSQMTCSRYEQPLPTNQCCHKPKVQVQVLVQDQIRQQIKPQTCIRASCNNNQCQCRNKANDIHSQPLKNSTVYPKQIKHSLYSYEKSTLRRSHSQAIKQSKQYEGKKTLNQQKDNNEENLDPKVIEERKKRIKQWELVTRNLPNSSFTTYYGKPAFEAYGRGSSFKNLKSYNVMPHKGDNHPQDMQTHYAALLKGRQIKAISHIPRNPIEQLKKPFQQIKNQQNINLPMQKPDLVKNKRFATPKSKPLTAVKRQRIPTQSVPHNPTITKSFKPKDNLTISQVSEKGKNKKGKKNVVANDGLKYMNKRDNLISLLEDKKTKASQLAYKVTQCCPIEWNCSNVCESKLVQRKDLSPAGKKYQEGDHVKDVMIQARV